MSKISVLEMPTKAYYSGFCGLELKEIEYGIDDYIICVSNSLGGGVTRRKHIDSRLDTKKVTTSRS